MTAIADTPAGAIDAFGSRAVAFLEANAQRRPVDAEGHVLAPGAFAGARAEDAQIVAWARAFQAALAAAGLAGIAVPAQYGGAGLTHAEERRFALEASRFDLPHMTPLVVGLHLVVPTLLAHGSEEQKERFIGPILRGEEVWCQLFSEPGAGSDLASLSTRAEPHGDDWRVDGQKVWTSFATHAEFGLLMARTTRGEGPKHRGITMFVLPMDADGIDVRPLREMTGGTHFSEVFLSDVRVAGDGVVGAVDDGWRVGMTTLGTERSAGADDAGSRAWTVIDLARRSGRAQDPVVRQELARLWTAERALQIVAERVRAETEAGQPPAWGGSVLKLMHARFEQSCARLAALLGGEGTTAWPPDDPEGPKLAFELLYSRMWSIAGGSDEIQRNILAERALGLPREPR